MQRVILDMDTGTDDAQAIILAAKSPELKIEAITAVAGNSDIEKTAKNSLKVLELLGIRNIPVAKGMGKSLVRDPRLRKGRRSGHGVDGLGNTFLPEPEGSLSEKHAVDLIIDTVMAHPGEVALVPTGPLTNIAMAVLKEPRIVDEVSEVSLMGGVFGVTPYGIGNATPVSEANIASDPEAARIVLRAGFRKITCVGLDTTTDPSACIHKEHFKRFSRDDPVEDFIVRLNRWRMTSFAISEDFSHLHDVQAVAYLIDRTLFKTEIFAADVIDRVSDDSLVRGQIVIDRRKSRAVYPQEPAIIEVCTAIDGPRFIELFISRITGRKE